MEVLGYTIEKGSNFSDIQKSYSDIKKKLKAYKRLRPSTDYFNRGYGASGGRGGGGSYSGYVPHYQIGSHFFESLATQSDIFMISINALKNKIFRRGFDIKEKSDKNEEQLSQLRKLLIKINDNNESLKDISKLMEKDFNIFDDGYLIHIREYLFKTDGEIASWIPKETIRASPTVMAKIADSEGRLG